MLSPFANVCPFFLSYIDDNNRFTSLRRTMLRFRTMAEWLPRMVFHSNGTGLGRSGLNKLVGRKNPLATYFLVAFVLGILDLSLSLSNGGEP